MFVTPLIDEATSRPSRVIAEALVGRHGPFQIVDRAAALGLPRPLTDVIVVACTSTAIDACCPQRALRQTAAF